jgi:integrase
MGLELRRDKNKNLRSKWWYGRYMIDGKRHFTNLGVEVKGKVPKNLHKQGDMAFECSRTLAAAKLKAFVSEATSQKVAEKHLQELYELKAGGKIGKMLITEISDRRFLAPARRGKSPQREKLQQNALKDFSSYIQKNHPAASDVSQVTKNMARGWLASLDEQNYSASTYNDKLHILKGFFDRIGDEAGVIRNPFSGCQTKIKRPLHRQPFTQEELTNILNHCDDLIHSVVLTAMCTAMRRGDCCRLKWECVDLKAEFITVKTSKTGELAEIPLFPALRAELEAIPRVSEYVFPDAEEMYRTNPDGITLRFQKALTAAKIKNVTAPTKTTIRRSNLKDFHSLRTTWITMALSAGVPMELVRRVTGHSTVDVVLKHYFRPGREAFRTALETAMPKMLTSGNEEQSDKGTEAQSAEAAQGKEESTLKTLRWLLKHGEDLEKKAILRKLAEIEAEMAA